MKVGELDYLGYITAIANVPSIIDAGILSHNRACRRSHIDISMESVQDIRARKRVPGGLVLHDYACLYVCARNVMLYKRCLTMRDELCVLAVEPAVLDLPDVVIADHNAAASIAAFGSYPDGLEALDYDKIFARYWTHPEDPMAEDRHRKEMCAEVLIPHRVDPAFIREAYVASSTARTGFADLGIDRNVTIKSDRFF
jgi:hypothetical protein